MVTINFIRDKEVGLFARAKRLGIKHVGAAKPDATVKEELAGSDSDKSE
jgi:hypothetical protein